MADSSRHSIYLIAEDDYGVTPDTPEFSTIRHTATNLGLSKSTLVSEELRADRQIADARHGVKQVGGDITTELSYSSFDDMLEASLMGTWGAKFVPYVHTTISAAAVDNSINDSANGFPVYEPGDVISITGFTGSAGNNQQGTVVSRTASKIVLTTTTPLVDDAAGESVTITSLTQMLKAGVTRRSFSILRYFSDLETGGYYLYKGCEFSKWVLTVAVNAIVKSVFSTIGQDQPAPTDAAPSGSTFDGPTTTSPMDSFSGALKEGGSALAVVTEIQQTLDNGQAVRNVIGSDKTILPSIGRSNLTAQITAYFEDGSLVSKFVNETESSLDYVLGDKAGNKYRVVLPRIKYNGGQPDTQGQGAITLTMPIQALYDSVTGTNIIVYKIPART